jgi:hypothetical protein
MRPFVLGMRDFSLKSPKTRCLFVQDRYLKKEFPHY